jgi:hypothetical protein
LHVKSQTLFTHVGAPFAGAAAHVVSVGAYEHVPPLHVPGDVKVRRVVAFVHVACGAPSHVIPAQGSPTHAPFWHDVAHRVVVLV